MKETSLRLEKKEDGCGYRYRWEARRLRVMTCAMFSGMQGERWASVED